jgi:ABC-type branched-subunit amino acid transport system substrate-binding protein
MVVSAGAVLALAACSNSKSPSPGDTGGSYNWGIDAELSGALSYYGASLGAGVQAYVDQANANGGVNGHQITLTQLDDAGDASRAAANATQLATANNVDAIFGHTLSANCSAAQPVIERYKIPMACLSIAQSSPWLFGLGPDNSVAAQPLFDTAKKVSNLSNPKVALVYLNTLTDEALAKDAGTKAAAAGVNLVTSQEIDLSASDSSNQVAQVVAAAPDVILISHTGPGFLGFLKSVRAAGLQVPIVWLDGTSAIGTLAQSTDQGVYAFSIWQLADPASTESGVKDFVAAITPQLKNGVTVATLNAGEYVTGYLTARAFGDALKTCGYPCSGENLRGQLEKVNLTVPGLVPSFTYTADSHYPFKGWYVYHVVGTTTTLVTTP